MPLTSPRLARFHAPVVLISLAFPWSLASATPPAATPPAAAAAEPPSGAAVLERGAAAIGGTEAWTRLGSMQIDGTIRIPAAGLEGTFTVARAAPARNLTTIALPGMPEIRTGYDGTVGWEIGSLGSRLLTRGETAAAAREADFLREADPVGRWDSLETVGDGEFGGASCWKVKAVKGDLAATLWFEKETGLPRGEESTVDLPAGRMPVTTVLSDYRAFETPAGSVRVPMVTTQRQLGQELVLTVRNATFGAVDPKTFDLPVTVAELVNPKPADGDAPPPGGKIVVRTADDLPRHTYPITGTALEILGDPAKLDPILENLILDAETDLDTYEIADTATLQGYYELLSSAYQLKGDLDLAILWSDRAGTLDTKEQERASRGHVLRALSDAAAASPDRADPAFIAAFRKSLKERMSAQPYELVKDRMLGIRGQARMISRELVEASLKASLDPLIAAANGEAGTEIASSLVDSKLTLDVLLPLLPHVAEVYGEIIDANANATKAASKWDVRLVELAAADAAQPVVVGIWDSGVDVALYPDRLWKNPAESANGKDDDGNGFVDDLHGIAFGLDRRPSVGTLASLDGLKGDRDTLIDFVAAAQDMQAGIENESVTRFQEHYRSLRDDTLRDFTDDMGLIGNYAHGTHVAGVAVAGNPFARLVHVTENWPWKSIPDEAPTVELGERWGESCRQAVAYLRAADARVVNMSWRLGRPAFEGMLSATGAGGSPEERAELSRRIFRPFRDGLEGAIRSAPDVLFIAGSGNEDNDVDFAEYVPAGLRLPNLLTVGAVDDQDRFTTFTSTGANVELYANGYRIPSLVPGGRTIPFSGTSMAAPQVANLAAKILALRPGLEPAEVIAIIRENADPIPDRPGRFIINPKRTIETLRAKP